MSAIEPNWPALFVFVPTWFTACVGLIYISGSLPLEAAPARVQTGLGSILIWLNILVLAALVVGSVYFAVSILKWTTLIVAGGFIFLFAPFVVQGLPDRMRDTPLGLIVLLCLAAAALALVGSNI